jgi:FKBP-type peptidyl-prolyl cis-trans isomerase
MTLLGCGGGDAGTPQYPEARHQATDAAPAVDLTAMTQTASGLYMQDLEVGEGEEALPGQSVTVYYTGWFQDGEKFDSSLDRGDTFSFPLGGGRVIAGWDEGVAGMRVGGWRRLVIPPALAYGEAGRQGIPPNSTLVFDVELLDVGG